MKNSLFTKFNPSNELFRLLKENNPTWWQFVKENIKPGGFYVDIRKDNSLNVYYNGGSLLKITLSYGKIKCKIHQYYLGEKSGRYVTYNPDLLLKEIDSIKEKIESRYANTSENGIKARLICHSDARYIDSEFAYPEVCGKKKNKNGKEVDVYQTTRIDLVKLEKKKIVFVELKRIEDGRLLNRDVNQEPKVLSQMKAYHEFVRKHKEEIVLYYKKLFALKCSLGILPMSLTGINHIDDYTVSDVVELYIEPYSFLSKRRIHRIEAIKNILDKNKIKHNLLEIGEF